MHHIYSAFIPSLLLASCLTTKPSAPDTWKNHHSKKSLIWVPGNEGHPEDYKIFALQNPDIDMYFYDRYDSDLHWKSQLRRLNQVVESVKPGHQVILAGHSYGGTLSIAYALTHPKKIHELIIISAPTTSQLQPTWERVASKISDYLPQGSIYRVLYENKQLEELWAYIASMKRPLSIKISGIFDKNDIKVSPANAAILDSLSHQSTTLLTERQGHGGHFRNPEIIRTVLGLKSIF